MKKTTRLTTFQIRWLNTKSIPLLFLIFFLNILQLSAQTFNYTGSVQTVTLQPGTYEIEMWGANGGGTQGGKGGYTKGTYAHSGGALYIVVGGAGGTGGIPADINGGYNGGGARPNPGGATRGSGGGATHISSSSGLLSDTTVRTNIVLVAGGGGGGSNSGAGVGGGGGITGANSNGNNPGQGGTQTAGGAAGAGTSGSPGTAGQGGQSLDMAGAGGGGWYGGGAGGGSISGNNGNGGGGGSGYINAIGITNAITLVHTDPGFVQNPDANGNGTVIITSLIPCSGTPLGGSATASPSTRACGNVPFTLSVTNTTLGGGLIYKWQRSDSGANNFSDISGANQLSYTVTNQTVSSDYRFVVTCTNSNSTSYSNIVTMIQPAAAGVFTENFDSTTTGSTTNATYPTCWSYIDDIATTGYGYVEASTAQSGVNSYRLYRTNSTSNAAQKLILISPETDNLGNGTKQLRFYAMASSTNASNVLEIVRSNGITSSSAFTVIQTITVDHTGYKEYVVPLPVTTDDYFGFSLAYNNTTTTTDINIDDVFYEDLETCFYPSNITVSNLTATGGDISWTPSPITVGGTGYEYEIRTSGAPGSGATGLAANGTTTNLSVTISTLNANTQYTVHIRSLCGTSTSRWNPNVEKFTTLCTTFNNFIEKFDTTTVGSASKTGANWPNCWSYIDTVTTGYGYVIAATPQSSPNTYRLYRTNATAGVNQELVLVSPITNNLGNGAKQLRFSVRSYSTTTYNNKLEILSMPTNTSTTGATVLSTVTNTNTTGQTWQEYIVAIPPTTDDYFAFRLAYNGTTTASSVIIDDVYFEDAPPPSLSVISVANILCAGDSTGSAKVEVTGGALPLSFAWSPSGGTSDTATGLTTGTYIVTVTDGVNRVATETITITEPEPLLANVVKTDVSCYGLSDGSISVAPTGGVSPYTYLWNNADTTDSLSNLSGGTYTITITDANGCSITENINIINPTVLSIVNSTYTNVSNYGGSDGSASVVVSGGTAPYSYLWSNNATTDTASNLVAGTYTVTVTDANGCTVTETFTIIQPIPLMVQSVSQKNVACHGGVDGTATIVVTGGNAPYSYLWSPTGGTNATATGLAAGTYSVLVTDATADTITESFTILEPDAITATISHQSDALCNGSSNGSATISVVGGSAPYTYTWSNGQTTTNATVSNLKAGNYTVNITDANGCKLAVALAVTIAQPSAIVFTTANATNISCYGSNDGSISVNVTGGVAPYNYIWSNGQSGSSIQNLAKGTYIVTVTDANNCTSTQTFSITEPAFVGAPTANNQIFCVDQNATLADVLVNGTNIKWYNTAVGGLELPATTVLTNGTTYYASQTVGTCESATRTAVQITLNQSVPITTSQLSVCGNTRIQNMIVDGLNYTQLRWYSSSTSAIPLASSVLLANGTYYVSSIIGTCESARIAIQVQVAGTVNAPIASFQTVCSGTTLNDLLVLKDPLATLEWFSSMQSMIPLPGTTAVATGTYYVKQVLGACESSKIAVQVQVTTVTTPTITSVTACEGTTIADYNNMGNVNYIWYLDNTTTTALADSYVLTSGTYYIANQNGTCVSARKAIALNVGPRPASPTGQTTQLFTYAARVSNLAMNEPNVKWYLSAADAVNMTNELPANTYLTDATTYYGILTNANNCGSLIPTAVTVSLNLGNESLDLAELKYYPNPVDTELNISYNEEINKVEVFTITGQKVLSNTYQSKDVRLDLSKLSSGTYLVKIETLKASQFVKVIKR